MTDKDARSSTEDVKAKMREALDRKKARGNAVHGDGGHGAGKAQGVAAPGLKRQFRRKSG